MSIAAPSADPVDPVDDPADDVGKMPSAEHFHVPVLAVIGVGLIGGSVALALKQQKRVGKVIGAGRSRQSLQRALDLGGIDEIADSAACAAAQADLILLATPVNAIAELLGVIMPHLDQNKVLTDVGSVKAGVCAAARAVLGDNLRRFVPAHPVAGKEHSGVASASADLFYNHNVVLTPSAHTDADAIERVTQLWSALGARVSTMDAELHDRVLSLTSHLPHVLAYAMVDFFADSGDLAHGYAMAAGGFYDFTRTASSEPEMWRDICLMNRQQILRHIDQFTERLARIRGSIEQSDGDALQRLFVAARETRSRVAERRKPRP